MQPNDLRAPFPYFGGKSKVAPLVWERFGAVQNYVEPFFGSGAVLLGCPWPGHTETVNDADGLLVNFWRALQAAPDEVAHYADWPVSEADLHARHRWLVDSRERVERLLSEPEWYDAKAAGWWVWGISQWIGTGWCPVGAAPAAKAPHISAGASGSDKGMGVHSGATGRGVHSGRLSRRLPHLGGTGGETARGVERQPLREEGALYDYFRALAARLRRTRVVCGDFARVLGDSVTWRHGATAVFLDPPYADGEHAVSYAGGGGVWERVTTYCEANGANPLLRIALCGYAGTWEPPAGWVALPWKARGGYGSQGSGRGRANAEREVIWFSPHCVNETPMERLLREAA